MPDNIMLFDDGHKAVISYDSDLDMFRGDFIGMEGAVFYGDSIESLRNDGEESLRQAASG